MGDEVENSACHDTLRLCLLEEELQLQVSCTQTSEIFTMDGDILFLGKVMAIFQIGTMFL